MMAVVAGASHTRERGGGPSSARGTAGGGGRARRPDRGHQVDRHRPGSGSRWAASYVTRVGVPQGRGSPFRVVAPGRSAYAPRVCGRSWFPHCFNFQ